MSLNLSCLSYTQYAVIHCNITFLTGHYALWRVGQHCKMHEYIFMARTNFTEAAVSDIYV